MSEHVRRRRLLSVEDAGVIASAAHRSIAGLSNSVQARRQLQGTAPYMTSVSAMKDTLDAALLDGRLYRVLRTSRLDALTNISFHDHLASNAQVVSGSFGLGGYTLATFNSVERHRFALGVASLTSVLPEMVTITSVVYNDDDVVGGVVVAWTATVVEM